MLSGTDITGIDALHPATLKGFQLLVGIDVVHDFLAINNHVHGIQPDIMVRDHGDKEGDLGIGGIDQRLFQLQQLCRNRQHISLDVLHLLIQPSQPAFATLRTQWAGTLLLNTPRDVDSDFAELENLADWGVISAAVVGRAFLANPDLVLRLRAGAQLNEPDASTFYAAGPRGYIDYPTLTESVTSPSA